MHLVVQFPCLLLVQVEQHNLKFYDFHEILQEFIHSVLLAVTLAITCNRIFNSSTNSIDSKQFIYISIGPSHCRKGTNTRINQQDKTKSIPPGFIYGSSLPSKLQVETNRIPAIIHIFRSQKFLDGFKLHYNYQVIIWQLLRNQNILFHSKWHLIKIQFLECEMVNHYTSRKQHYNDGMSRLNDATCRLIQAQNTTKMLIIKRFEINNEESQ
ncbi:Hypothetical_protein [Hexamita inflata]|uniref:Hypothetical_protein n=1 Tax=Hexamita inflata TaxID=28002 RepID=A0ABP1GGP9_9EUKA